MPLVTEDGHLEALNSGTQTKNAASAKTSCERLNAIVQLKSVFVAKPTATTTPTKIT